MCKGPNKGIINSLKHQTHLYPKTMWSLYMWFGLNYIWFFELVKEYFQLISTIFQVQQKIYIYFGFSVEQPYRLHHSSRDCTVTNFFLSLCCLSYLILSSTLIFSMCIGYTLTGDCSIACWYESLNAISVHVQVRSCPPRGTGVQNGWIDG